MRAPGTGEVRQVTQNDIPRVLQTSGPSALSLLGGHGGPGLAAGVQGRTLCHAASATEPWGQERGWARDAAPRSLGP